MNPIAITKLVVGLAASGGVGTIVGVVIRNNVPAQTKLLSKIGIGLGTAVLGGIAGDLTKTWTDKQIDNIVSSYKTGKALGDKLTENL